MADEGWLGGLLGKFANLDNPNALYGGLLSDEATQRALNWRGLMSAVGSLGQSAMPSRLPVPLGGALGIAAGAMGAGEDAAIKARTEAAQGLLYGAQGQQALANIGLLQTVNKNLAGGVPDERLPGQVAATPAAGGGAVTGGAKATPGNAFDTGDPELNLIAKYESSYNPNIGWGQTDLSGAKLRPDGFPIWAGKPGPAGNSSAAGLFQIQPDTWAPIAKKLGITDFSVESQIKVAKELKAQEGLNPWVPYNPELANAVKRKEVVQFPTATQTAAAPSAPPNPTLAPGAAPQGLLSVPVPPADLGQTGRPSPPAGPGQQAADQTAVPPAAQASADVLPPRAARLAAMVQGQRQAQEGTPAGLLSQAAGGNVAAEPTLVAPPGAAGLVFRPGPLIAPPGPAAAVPPAAGPPVTVPTAPDTPAAPLPDPTPAQAATVAQHVGPPPPPADPLGGVNPAYVKWAQNMSLAFSLLHLDTPDNIKQAASLGMVGPTAAAKAAAEQPFTQQNELYKKQVEAQYAGVISRLQAEGTLPSDLTKITTEQALKLRNEMATKGLRFNDQGGVDAIPGFNPATAATAGAVAAAQEEAKRQALLDTPANIPGVGYGTPRDIQARGAAGALVSAEQQASATEMGKLGPAALAERQKMLADYYANNVVKPADAAENAKQPLIALQNTLDDFRTGVYGSNRLAFGKTLVDIGQTLGIAPSSDIGKMLAAGELITKQGTTLGFELAKTLGSRESENIVRQAIAANPGIQNTAEGNKQLISLVMQGLQREIAKRNFYDNYFLQNRGSYEGAYQAFQKQNPIEVSVSQVIPYKVRSQADIDRQQLPPGTRFIGPDNNLHTVGGGGG